MPALLHKHERDAIAATIKADIDQYCKVAYDDGFRNHLGASLIGHACNRHLWYVFRWVLPSQFRGRMQRLFNRGHETEPRFIEWLRGIGAEVWAEDENGKQFRIDDVAGHFGGSLDAVIRLPARYGVPGNEPLLNEFKTHNEKSFNKLTKEGVKRSKPTHFAQMSVYGYKRGFKYALYCAINKNDDDIHIEIVELDFKLAAELIKRAEFVITSPAPPSRYSEDPANFECKFCDHWEICHKGANYAKNCRSCENAVPVDGAQWFCKAYGSIIPEDVIKVGCVGWKPVGRLA